MNRVMTCEFTLPKNFIVQNCTIQFTDSQKIRKKRNIKYKTKIQQNVN